MKTALSICLLLISSYALIGQNYICGSESALLHPNERAKALAFYRQKTRTSAVEKTIDSVAIAAHIVRSSAFLPLEISEKDIAAEIEKINDAFSGTNIVFFLLKATRYFEGKKTYSIDEGDELTSMDYLPNTINIYLVEDILDGIIGFAKFPWTGVEGDRFIMLKIEHATDGATLTHEMGHYYGLWHTHETQFDFECVDGSNCLTAGDLICDTPADPGLSYLNQCIYANQQTDRKGQIYHPQVNNYMSYAPQSCQDTFTQQQKKIMRAIHENPYAISFPDFAIDSHDHEITVRSGQNFTIEYEFWNKDIEEDYEVELNILLTNTLEQDQGKLLHQEKINISPGQNKFSRKINIDFPKLTVSGTYYIRATIDSEFDVAEFDEGNNTVFSTAIVDNSSFDEAFIFPNPASTELYLYFRDALVSGVLNIGIYHYDGRCLRSYGGAKTHGEYFHQFDISDLSSGIYFITIDFEKVQKSHAFKFLKK